MALQPFVGPWPLFQFLDLLHGRAPWMVDQPVARRLPVFVILPVHSRSRNSIVGIAILSGLRRPRGWSSSPSRVRNLLFSTSSTPGLRPTQPPIQWVPAVLSRGLKLTTHLQLVPSSSKCGSIRSVPHTLSWRSA
jgi:hypothetical protein